MGVSDSESAVSGTKMNGYENECKRRAKVSKLATHRHRRCARGENFGTRLAQDHQNSFYLPETAFFQSSNFET